MTEAAERWSACSIATGAWPRTWRQPAHQGVSWRSQGRWRRARPHRPNSETGSKYVRMQSFLDRPAAPGQRQTWYPWPYTEALTLPEAAHELAFIVTGVYGRPLPKQFGAPLRLAVPWKYGFKSVKSLTRFSIVEDRPK